MKLEALINTLSYPDGRDVELRIEVNHSSH